ncbi:MAG: hypothetical protein MMC33_001658 [Icmadophila ericetorum]|nr:hypothetical protein [Icmadophila ericetorum]
MDHSHLIPGGPGVQDFAQGAPTDLSPLSQSIHGQPARFNEDFDASRRGSSIVDVDGLGSGHLQRADSTISQSNTLTPSRGGTLKKKQSIKRTGSLKRSSSRKSLRAGSLSLGEKEKYSDGHGDEMNSAFYTPVPTSGNPTDILANRFQAWRSVLKNLITYFRDVQKSYEARAKSLLMMSNVINNTSIPPVFLTEGGIGDAIHLLRDFNKQALAEGNKAKALEEDVIVQLTGLRSDLQQKIKEIKSLAGDFKNSVDKETEATRKAVRGLQEALGLVDLEPSATSGKGDPFIVKLGVERQIERQIDEENYLHRAFLNLENSGRELESIVVGEIQKAYNVYTGIMKREADHIYETVENIRSGPIGMPKDREWDAFVDNNEHFVNPRIPIRRTEKIVYAGKDHPAALEVRSGLLERKSKYLKSYTPGWYVLSPTHLHEFKSADHIHSQTPIMSLYLPEQKLGSHSSADSASHKFMLKGRQTGGMHRGHGWVFRAESYDTMMAWYEDIKSLAEKTGEERNAFVRRHARSASNGSQKAGSISSEGALEDDEADEAPYSATASQFTQPSSQEPKLSERPQPGGRFPSDLNVNRDLQQLSPSSGASSNDRDIIAAANNLPGTSNEYDPAAQHPKNQVYGRYMSGGLNESNAPNLHAPFNDTYEPIQKKRENNNLLVLQGPNPSTTSNSHQLDDSYFPVTQGKSTSFGAEYNQMPFESQGISSEGPGAVAYTTASSHPQNSFPKTAPHQSDKPTDTLAGAAAGVAGAEVYHDHQQPTSSKTAQTSLLQPQTPKTNTDPTELAQYGSSPTSSKQKFPETPPQTTPTQIATTTTNPDVDLTIPFSASSTNHGTAQSQIAPSSPLERASERPMMPSGYSSMQTLSTLDSVMTVSDLHIPGEFPRTPATPFTSV